MYTVYVLQDEEGHFYKGMTNDLVRRLAEHRRGKTRTTSAHAERTCRLYRAVSNKRSGNAARAVLKNRSRSSFSLEEVGGVAQLVRASACHAEGRGFESRPSRQFLGIV